MHRRKVSIEAKAVTAVAAAPQSPIFNSSIIKIVEILEKIVSKIVLIIKREKWL